MNFKNSYKKTDSFFIRFLTKALLKQYNKFWFQILHYIEMAAILVAEISRS